MFKLKNIYTGEVVYCKDLSDTSESNEVTFIKVISEKHPQKYYNANREAFVILESFSI
jgi:hypothetical protein